MPPTPFPKRITLEVSSRCNLACRFCSRHQSRMELGDMDFALFRRVVDAAADHLPVCLVVFFRGEPLLHPQLEEMIAYAKGRGLGPIQMASNGLLLDARRAEALLDSGLDFISFSLDTNDEELYRRVRVNGELARARENILRFIDLARRVKSPVEIQVSAVDHDDYRPGQADFIEFWRQKADKVRIYLEHGSDGRFGRLKNHEELGQMERRPCRKVFEEMVVYWDGKTALCNHDWQNDSPPGDLSVQTVAEVWNSPAYAAVRRAHETGDFDGLACQWCDHWRMYYAEGGLMGELYERDR